MSTNPDLDATGFREFPAPPAPDRAFGIWAPPGATEVVVALLPASGRRTPAAAPAWYSSGFFSSPSSGPWFPVLHHHRISRDFFESLLRNAGPVQPSWRWSETSEEQSQFQASVRDVLDRLRKGSLRKAVPIAFLNSPEKRAPTSSELAWLLLEALRFQARAGGTLYGLWNESEGIVGVTPELLFEQRGGRISTMALAGTRGFEPEHREQAASALLADEKEKREHRWVIEGIAEALAGLGTVTVGETGIREAGPLLHLHTPMELCTFANGAEDLWSPLVERLHPTPALGAYPREPGNTWLLEQEHRNPRHRFGAPFGIRLDDQESCVVAIRNLEWNSSAGFCRMGAGAGVVEGSTPEREWSEIRRKWNAVLKIFGLEKVQ